MQHHRKLITLEHFQYYKLRIRAVNNTSLRLCIRSKRNTVLKAINTFYRCFFNKRNQCSTIV